jgi:hypothetical protein
MYTDTVVKNYLGKTPEIRSDMPGNVIRAAQRLAWASPDLQDAINGNCVTSAAHIGFKWSRWSENGMNSFELIKIQ